MCEQFLGSARRECLHDIPILGERPHCPTLAEYVVYFNRDRPQQGLGRKIPMAGAEAAIPTAASSKHPRSEGFIPPYHRAAWCCNNPADDAGSQDR